MRKLQGQNRFCRREEVCMRYIEVQIRPAGANPPIVVSHPREAVRGGEEGEFIFWQIYSANRKVKKVRIEFKSAEFFDPPRTFIEEKIKYPAAPDVSGTACIWGRAPIKVRKPFRRDKYTVKGLNAKGTDDDVVVPLDPEIITVPPR